MCSSPPIPVLLATDRRSIYMYSNLMVDTFIANASVEEQVIR